MVLRTLTIRAEQMDAFLADARRRFADRLISQLRAIYPDEVPAEGEEDGELRLLIGAGIDNAKLYGVETETDVARFVEYMIYFHPDFDIDPDMSVITEVLADEYLSGTEKMDRIDQIVSLDSPALPS